MKKIIILISAVLLALTSCMQYEDTYYDKSPDDRLIEAIEEYTDIILSAPNGWFLTVNTGVSGGYRHWVSFSANNRVVMLSDLDASPTWNGDSTSEIPQDLSWRMKAGALPMLIFDTYGYLHILSDPQGSAGNGRPGNGGTNGEGLKSDFEFYIFGVDAGELILQGRNNRCFARLTAATPEEAQAAVNGKLHDIHAKTSEHLTSLDFLVSDINGTDVVFNLSTRQVTASYVNAKGVLTESYSGAYPDFQCVLDDTESSNINLFEVLEVNGETIVGFLWNGNNYMAVTQTGENIVIEPSAISPIPLNIKYRGDFSSMLLSVDLPGTQSAEFMDEVYLKVMDNWHDKRSPRRLSSWTMIWDVDSNNNDKPYLKLEFIYTSGTSKYTGNWVFQYTDNGDGTITITDRDNSGKSNEYTNDSYVKDFLDYFCYVEYTTMPDATSPFGVKDKTKTKPRTFLVTWAKNKTPGSGAQTGAFVPVDTGDATYIPYPCIGVLQ